MKPLIAFLASAAISSASAWQIVNDGVMGGISSSNVGMVEDYMRFQGNLSLANNGGFASIRTPVNIDQQNPKGIRMEVRGDGRTYQIRLQTPQVQRGPSYAMDFATVAGEWQVIELPAEDFFLTYRGFNFRDYPALDIEQARVLSIFIADKIEGPFQLDIRSFELM